MAKHHPDLIFCRKQAGVAIGKYCLVLCIFTIARQLKMDKTSWT